MATTPNSSIDEYIAQFPASSRKILQLMRTTIRKDMPEAQETIAYGLPTFKLNGKNVVHYAAFKEHIGFYATLSGNAAFQKELVQFKTGKGSVQFPLDKPLPLALISKMVKFRLKEVKSKDLRTTGKA